MPAELIENEIAHLAQKFARNPDSRIFAPLADALRQAGRVSEAIGICRQGLRHHPDYLSGQIVLARCHHDEGDHEMAAAVFGQVVEADPRNVSALRSLGEIAEAVGDRRAAAAWYRKALEVDPDDPELRERLTSLGAPATASGEEVAREADRGAPDARGSETAGARAASHPEPLATVGEEHAITTVTLAEIYVEQGLHDRALAVYRRVLAEDPGNRGLREKVADLERRLAGRRASPEPASGADLAGFVTGTFGVEGGEPGSARPLEAMTAREGAAEGGMRPGAPVEAWAFLLVDEEDQDPDEVFSGPTGSGAAASRAAASGSTESGATGAGATASGAASGATVSGAAASGAAAAGLAASSEPQDRHSHGDSAERDKARDDEDLKRFQEWLRNLK